MNSGAMARVALQVRLLLARFGVVGVVSALLIAACAVAIVWLGQATAQVERRHHEAAARMATLPLRAAQEARLAVDDNSGQFYQALGERRYAGEQVRTMFALASKSGLELSKGEYREAFDPNAKVWTYQVTLPVKGTYGAIWDFTLQSLKAIPFAALDDIGFRRDAIGDANVEARLRFTLYLRDLPAGDDR